MLKRHKIALVTALTLTASSASLLSIGFATWGISQSDRSLLSNPSVDTDFYDDLLSGVDVTFHSVFTMGTYQFVDSNGDAQSQGLLQYKIEADYSSVNADIKSNTGFVIKVKLSFGDSANNIFVSPYFDSLTAAPTATHTFGATITDITPADVLYKEYLLDITSSSDEGILTFAFNQSLFRYRDYVLSGVFHLTVEGVPQ